MVCILLLYFRGGTRNLLWEVPSKYTKMHIRELEYGLHFATVLSRRDPQFIVGDALEVHKKCTYANWSMYRIERKYTKMHFYWFIGNGL